MQSKESYRDKVKQAEELLEKVNLLHKKKAKNGGDLNINVKYPSKSFNEELKKIIDNGYEVKRIPHRVVFF